MTPEEFELFVAEALRAAARELPGLTVTTRDTVTAADGSYVFDATARYEVGGLSFVVIIEAKRHSAPIKRRDVQVLHQQTLSVGAHKAVLFSTSPFQRGALEFAGAHGIALVVMTEGRFTIETKSMDAPPVPTREVASQLFRLPVFVGHWYTFADTPGSIAITLISPDNPEHIADLLRVAKADEESSS